MQFFKDIHIKLDPEMVVRTLHPHGSGGDAVEIYRFIDIVLTHVDPMAAYLSVLIDQRGDDFLQLGEFRFVSRILARHVAKDKGVFPYVVTLGSRIEEIFASSRNVLQHYYLEIIAHLALEEACRQLNFSIAREFQIPELYRLSPGTLSDWPLEEQAKIFALLGPVEESLGVRLTEHMLMLPRMSLSGIFFESQIPFSECRFCHMRDRCELSKSARDRRTQNSGIRDICSEGTKAGE
jgi:hypothetical protein